MKKLLVALPVVAMMSSAALAQTATQPPYTPSVGPKAGDYEALLSGSGTSTKNFDANTLGVTGSLGYYWTDNVEVGFRQTAGFGVGSDTNDVWNGTSVVFVDYVFDFGRWRPFLGAFIGGVYGKSVKDDGIGGLEGGVKYYVNETTFLIGSASYGPTFTEGFDEGSLQYIVGVGFNF